ncbi:MAG: L,D-transpeptidase [Planctomycetota bacterium]
MPTHSRSLRPRFLGLLTATIFVAPNPVFPAPPDQDLRLQVAWQVALERIGLSPGIIDGNAGRKTELATREFQRVHGLPVTGRLDPRTKDLLEVNPDAAVTAYALQASDLALVGPAPQEWIAKSKLKRLAYESLDAAIAERFHCSRALLAALNPERKIGGLQPGEVINVPSIEEGASSRSGSLVEINLGDKTVRVLDRNHEVIGLFHCSIAKHREKRPSGSASVVSVTENPAYTFDPKMWPEVKGVENKLLIPPGPRNPVGLCWIGLNLPGYGIHGSPAPEMIGKTGSHGCFRLTNWDALRLARMIRVGTHVRFLDETSLAAADRPSASYTLAEAAPKRR